LSPKIPPLSDSPQIFVAGERDTTAKRPDVGILVPVKGPVKKIIGFSLLRELTRGFENLVMRYAPRLVPPINCCRISSDRITFSVLLVLKFICNIPPL